MELRLVIMGLLMRGPTHGYDLKQTLEKELSPFFEVSSAPLYYTLKKLEQEGFVNKWSTVSGNRPTKYVYSLTAKGQEEITELMLKNITYLHRPSFNLDISLFFLNFLNPQDVVKTLKKRLKELRKLRFVLDRQKKEELATGAARKKEYIIMAHNIRVTEAEMEFVKDLIEAFSQGGIDININGIKTNHDRR
ncbi:MAG: PadR family transcriptional regulator [Deltaproteobacteria bacterium]|nr:PadR family transcriptional regulator [Deltaproteobacteria bacterium]